MGRGYKGICWRAAQARFGRVQPYSPTYRHRHAGHAVGDRAEGPPGELVVHALAINLQHIRGQGPCIDSLRRTKDKSSGAASPRHSGAASPRHGAHDAREPGRGLKAGRPFAVPAE